MKLNIMLFGGRGTGSGGSIKGNKIIMRQNNKKINVNFNSLKKGDTFEVKGRAGTYNLKIDSSTRTTNYEAYSVSGQLKGSNERSTYISMLVKDEYYKKADAISKRYMLPLSKTKNWKRK